MAYPSGHSAAAHPNIAMIRAVLAGSPTMSRWCPRRPDRSSSVATSTWCSRRQGRLRWAPAGVAHDLAAANVDAGVDLALRTRVSSRLAAVDAPLHDLGPGASSRPRRRPTIPGGCRRPARRVLGAREELLDRLQLLSPACLGGRRRLSPLLRPFSRPLGGAPGERRQCTTEHEGCRQFPATPIRFLTTSPCTSACTRSRTGGFMSSSQQCKRRLHHGISNWPVPSGGCSHGGLYLATVTNGWCPSNSGSGA